MNGCFEREAVSVLGVGRMGRALAEASLASGHAVTVWNRTASRCTPVAKAGACTAQSPADAARAAEVVLVCVSDHEASLAILGSDGLEAALKGKVLMQLSTISPSQSRAVDVWCEDRGVGYLDAAILGYPADVVRKGARILFSGSPAVYQRCSRVIGGLTDQPLHIGERAGTAQVADKCVYAQFYGIVFAYLHAAALAATAGISLQDFRTLTSGEERWKWKGETIDGFLDRIESQRYSEAGATLDAHAEAYAHVARLSREVGIGKDFSDLVARTMAQAIERGHADHELAAMFEVLAGPADGAECGGNVRGGHALDGSA